MSWDQPPAARPVRVAIHLRTRIEGAHDGGWVYVYTAVRNPKGDSYLTTYWPPSIGDLFTVNGLQLAGTEGLTPMPPGALRVVDREWVHSSYGSADWPYTDNEPQIGPLLTVMVEVADTGLYPEEIVVSDEEDLDV
jgi:hypothetical protein